MISGVAVDADEYVRELVPLLSAGDVLAHPFTRHPGGFVSGETGAVHPVIWEALELPPERGGGKILNGEPGESAAELIRLLNEEAKVI